MSDRKWTLRYRLVMNPPGEWSRYRIEAERISRWTGKKLWELIGYCDTVDRYELKIEEHRNRHVLKDQVLREDVLV